MAAGFQKFICLGNVTRDPEVHETKSGKDVAKFSLAVNGFKDKVEYFDITFWEPGAVIEYINKGTLLLVEGELETETWEKDGEKRRKTVVVARRVQLCGGKHSGGEREPAAKGEGKRWDDFG